MSYSAERYHDISCGHRVVGHESKCRWMHGHNYRFHFKCEAAEGLDELGRVIDFGDIKKFLCQWLEDNWDHKFLIWANDPIQDMIHTAASAMLTDYGDVVGSFVTVPFNPTAENLAIHMVEVVGPEVLPEGIVLVECRIEETRKCSATAWVS